jgi:hypothetical protein
MPLNLDLLHLYFEKQKIKFMKRRKKINIDFSF